MPSARGPVLALVRTLATQYRKEGFYMKVKVLGIQMVDYVSRKTGNPVKGTTLHSVFKDVNVSGQAVSGIFVSDNLGISCISDIRPGMEVDIQYNNRGYVCDVAICK